MLLLILLIHRVILFILALIESFNSWKLYISFSIIINFIDLHYLILICFTSIKLLLCYKILFVFWYKTATMNFVILAKFLFIICETVFNSLFAISHANVGILGLISSFLPLFKQVWNALPALFYWAKKLITSGNTMILYWKQY